MTTIIRSIIFIVSSFLFLSAQVQSAEFELALSNESAAAEILADSSAVGSGGADLKLGLIFNEADDIMGQAGLIVRGASVGNQSFIFGLGAALYYGTLDEPDANVGSLALGFGATLIIPGNTPVGIGGEFFFAPDVTSFSDSEGLLDYRLRAEIEILPSAIAFIGYRGLEVDLSNAGDHEVDSNFHLGVRFAF